MYRKSRKRCHYVSSLHLPQNFPLPSFVAFPPLQFCISSTCKSIFPLLVACSFRKESVEDATQKLRQLFGDHTQNFIIACHVQCFPKNMYNIQILKIIFYENGKTGISGSPILNVLFVHVIRLSAFSNFYHSKNFQNLAESLRYSCCIYTDFSAYFWVTLYDTYQITCS